MKSKRFSEEQIIAVLKQADAGARTKELGRRHGISEATFYNWKQQVEGVEHDLMAGVGTPMLERLERRAPLSVKRDDLPVHHRQAGLQPRA